MANVDEINTTGGIAMHYEVIVGNIGTVYSGTSKTEADNAVKAYTLRSALNLGRCAGESVTLFVDGEIESEYIGSLANEE